MKDSCITNNLVVDLTQFAQAYPGVDNRDMHDSQIIPVAATATATAGDFILKILYSQI